MIILGIEKDEQIYRNVIKAFNKITVHVLSIKPKHQEPNKILT